MSRLLVPCLSFILMCSACGPMSDRCRDDGDCMTGEHCYVDVCVQSRAEADAGSKDAGKPEVDAGVADAGEPDAGVIDAGQPDAGEPDAGPMLPCEVGETRACCSERGSQTCEEADAGVAWSSCSVSPTQELCNGIDDDCDGTVDNSLEYEVGDAGTSPDAGCSVGVGACVREGSLVCSASAPVCSATAGEPSAETCNLVDDDCDGMADEGATCVISGQSCVAGACVCPTNQTVCNGFCQTVGATCESGVGACRRSGVTACSSNAVSCNAVEGTPGTETCNNIDDDCDGQTDEGASICAIGGQTCVSGACVCPAGQVACGGSCEVVGQACSDGVGACQRTGQMACNSAGVIACNAVKGTATTEICDGIDNDCDGAVDETLRVDCLPDSDNDRYANAGFNFISQQCRDERRVSFGYCPANFIAVNSNQGLDCATNDAARFRTMSVRTDADGDEYCVGLAQSECIGAQPAATKRLADTCRMTTDCDDNNPALFVNYNARIDMDNDSFCTAAPAADFCIGSTVTAGLRNPVTCNATTDVIDTNPFATSLREQNGTSFTSVKRCGTMPVVESLAFAWSCPTGYHAVNSAYVYGSPNAQVSEALDYPQASGASGVVQGNFRCKFAAQGVDTWTVHVVCRADGL